MNIRIRHAQGGDHLSILRFLRTMMKAEEPIGGHEINPDDVFWQEYGDKLAQFLEQGHRLFLIADAGDRALGCLCGKVAELHGVFLQKKTFRIQAVYVAPESRQRGVATALLQKALRWASSKGCEESDLSVLAGNGGAQALYAKLGFEPFRHELRIRLPA